MSLHSTLHDLSLILLTASLTSIFMTLAAASSLRWPSSAKLRKTRNPFLRRKVIRYQADRAYSVTQLGDILHNPSTTARNLDYIAKKTLNKEIRVLVALHPNATSEVLHRLAAGDLTTELRSALLANPTLDDSDRNFLILDQLATPERDTARSSWSDSVLSETLELVTA